MRSLPLLLATALACSSGSQGKEPQVPTAPDQPNLSIFMSAELKGSIEPCGCTADPLGDLARTTELVAKARAKGPVLFFDGGSTLYTDVKIPETRVGQEELKSRLIQSTFAEDLQVAAMGLGPYDLSLGAERIQHKRQAANISADSGLPLEAPKVIDAGGIKVGVLGLVSPLALSSAGLTVGDPAEAGKKAVAELQSQGAQVIVALAHMTRDEARALAKAVPEIDFLLMSQNAPEPKELRDEASKVGSTWLFRPANRGQSIARLDLYLRDSSPFADAVGAFRAEGLVAKLGTEIEALEAQLAEWKKDPSADQAFVTGKAKELEDMKAQQASLKAKPLQAPESGNFFTFSQLRINKAMACDAEVVAAKLDYDKAAGALNRKAVADKPIPQPAKGEASYMGMEDCDMCHGDAVEFWQKTSHARAWKTLTDLGKDGDFDCVACHMTAYDKPGGANLVKNEDFQNVQCEVCHGPGSLHLAAKGEAKKTTIVRSPGMELCITCHSPEHSDTFDFEAYLRDVTGPGHGEERRKALGDGPTGHELRKAALDKAGASLGANCPK